MQHIITQIIDMDRQARQITEAARAEKLEAEREVEQRAGALRTEFLERARRRIRIAGENERTIAEQKWRRIEKKYKDREERLDKLAAQRGDALADELVARVLGDRS